MTQKGSVGKSADEAPEEDVKDIVIPEVKRKLVQQQMAIFRKRRLPPTSDPYSLWLHLQVVTTELTLLGCGETTQYKDTELQWGKFIDKQSTQEESVLLKQKASTPSECGGAIKS